MHARDAMPSMLIITPCAHAQTMTALSEGKIRLKLKGWPLLEWVRSGSVYRAVLPVCPLNLEFGEANTRMTEV